MNYGSSSLRFRPSEELGLEVEGPSPLRAAFATFLVIGLAPLIPLVLPGLAMGTRFVASSVVTGVAFFVVGRSRA